LVWVSKFQLPEIIFSKNKADVIGSQRIPDTRTIHLLQAPLQHYNTYHIIIYFQPLTKNTFEIFSNLISKLLVAIIWIFYIWLACKTMGC